MPNLFAVDEKAEIMEAMRPIAMTQDKDAEYTPLMLLNLFTQRCKEHLHIILAMSPIGDVFRNRVRKFPSLINCCTIDWFQVSVVRSLYSSRRQHAAARFYRRVLCKRNCLM